MEEADGGTIFLDEIADMSKPLQAKLLRFLEDGTFTRVGGTQELRVNVRLIAATNRDIVEAIAAGQFPRGFVPPAERRAIPPAAAARAGRGHPAAGGAFFENVPRRDEQKHRTASPPAARQKLLAHHWPGNVRELRNVIERALILETDARNPAVQPAGFSSRSRVCKKPRRSRSPRTNRSTTRWRAWNGN